MNKKTSRSGRQLVLLCVLSLMGGGVGMVAGSVFSASLKTTPAWLGPSIVVGAFALLLVGILLLPAAIRVLRTRK